MGSIGSSSSEEAKPEHLWSELYAALAKGRLARRAKDQVKVEATTNSHNESGEDSSKSDCTSAVSSQCDTEPKSEPASPTFSCSPRHSKISHSVDALAEVATISKSFAIQLPNPALQPILISSSLLNESPKCKNSLIMLPTSTSYSLWHTSQATPAPAPTPTSYSFSFAPKSSVSRSDTNTTNDHETVEDAFKCDLVDVNKASLSDLQKLPGVGPVIAQRIIDERPFKRIDDLNRVRGIGASVFDKIKSSSLLSLW